MAPGVGSADGIETGPRGEWSGAAPGGADTVPDTLPDTATETAPAWDRFARWPRRWALALLVVLAGVLVAAAWVPLTVGRGEVAKVPVLAVGRSVGAARPRDDDLALYDRAIARIRRGENYYEFIVGEHRRAHYPVRPGLAVRLPTLAYLDAWCGVDGDAPAPVAMVLAVGLMLGVVWAWWRRLGDEGCEPTQRRMGTALVFLGASLGLNRYYFVLHELWAGMLIALAFGLHRAGGWRFDGRGVSGRGVLAGGHGGPPAGGGAADGAAGLAPDATADAAPMAAARRGDDHAWPAHDGGGLASGRGGGQDALPVQVGAGLATGSGGGAHARWFGAWCAAALALAIREHTLPFVLLLGAQALWRWWRGARGAGREALAWGALVAAFGVGLGVHLHLIAAQALPGDPVGPSWFALRGLHGWLSDVVLSSNLRFLPHWIAGPLVVLMVFGWAGWRTSAGAFGTVLYVGYGVAFMIAGRDDNFYWGAVIAPAMFVGLAFVPMASRSLVKSALAGAARGR